MEVRSDYISVPINESLPLIEKKSIHSFKKIYAISLAIIGFIVADVVLARFINRNYLQNNLMEKDDPEIYKKDMLIALYLLGISACLTTTIGGPLYYCFRKKQFSKIPS